MNDRRITVLDPATWRLRVGGIPRLLRDLSQRVPLAFAGEPSAILLHRERGRESNYQERGPLVTSGTHEDDRWRELLRPSHLLPIIEASEYVRSYDTDSLAFQVTGADGNDYVVKASHLRPGDFRPPHRDRAGVVHGDTPLFLDPPDSPGRYMKAVMSVDHLAIRFGEHFDAPVPPAKLIDITSSFIEANPEVGFVTPGLAHGTLFVEGLKGPYRPWPRVDRDVDRSNLPRYANAAMLFALIENVSDQQLFFVGTPRLMLSVDHGFSLGGARRDCATLNTLSTQSTQGVAIAYHLGLLPTDLANPLRKLEDLTDEKIGGLIGSLPGEWEIEEDELIATARCVARRRDNLMEEISNA